MFEQKGAILALLKHKSSGSYHKFYKKIKIKIK